MESSRKKTRPRKLDLYEVFCAVLYVLKSCCQWRIVAKRFSKVGKHILLFSNVE
ncbi:transposase [Wolbachia pipientis]|nr:transposase [Wolbachia pipientis]